LAFKAITIDPNVFNGECFRIENSIGEDDFYIDNETTLYYPDTIPDFPSVIPSASCLADVMIATNQEVASKYIDTVEDVGISNSYREMTYSGIKVITSTWYTDNTKSITLLNKTVIYAGIKPTSIVWNIFDPNNPGALVSTVTDTIVYSGIKELNRTRVVT